MQRWTVTGQNISVLGLLALTLLASSNMLALKPKEASAAPALRVNLAQDYPAAYFFMRTALRGSIDYYTIERDFAPSLAAVEAGGYTAYLLPQPQRITYKIGKNSAGEPQVQISSPHDPIYALGQHRTGSRMIGQGPPSPGLWHEVADPRAPRMAMIKTYNFPGAEYLERGYSLEESKVFIQREAWLTNLAWAAIEYLEGQTNTPPSKLSELEAFVGAKRNPAMWQHINLVSKIGEVELTPGNAYIGFDGSNRWVIRVNVGPAVKERKFWIVDKGQWAGRWAHWGSYVY